MNYENAMALLRKYNSEPFHICHAITVSKVMRRMAVELGYGEEADFWAVVGLLHDIDFEQWPDEHCKKCIPLLEEAGCDERLIHAVACHGYGLCTDLEPQHQMEKVLFAADELTGLIGAVWFGLICNEVINTGEFTEVGQYIDFKAAILFVVLLIITKKTDKHPLFYIAIAAIAGIVFSF